MTSEVIKLEGFKELEKALNALGSKHANAAMRSGIKTTANEIKRDAQERAPVGSESRIRKGVSLAPGTMRKNISVRTKVKRWQTGQTYIATVGFKGEGFHGSFFELGEGNIQRQPIIRPAFDRHVPKLDMLLQKKIEEAIARERVKMKK